MDLPVRITEQFPAHPDGLGEASISNISSGGIFITTPKPLPIASRVNLEILITFQDLKKLRVIVPLKALRRFQGKPVWIQASGVVIRHDAEGMAVIFDNDYQLSPIGYTDKPRN